MSQLVLPLRNWVNPEVKATKKWNLTPHSITLPLYQIEVRDATVLKWTLVIPLHHIETFTTPVLTSLWVSHYALGFSKSLVVISPWEKSYKHTKHRLGSNQWSGRSGLNPRLSHTKDSKMVLDAALLNSQYDKVRVKGKVEQSKEWSSAIPYTSV